MGYAMGVSCQDVLQNYSKINLLSHKFIRHPVRHLFSTVARTPPVTIALPFVGYAKGYGFSLSTQIASWNLDQAETS
jgi:hypothetical protein